MKYVLIVERILVGLLFALTGSNAFFKFMNPRPEDLAKFPKLAIDFTQSLNDSGYIYVIGVSQLFIAVCFLTNRFVPLALLVLAPMVVNILAVHVFLLPGIAPGLVVAAILCHQMWAYRALYRPLLAAKNSPA